MGDLSWLKSIQSNTLCSGFFTKTLSWGFWQFFPTGTYAGIGIVCRVWKCNEKYHEKKNWVLFFKLFYLSYPGWLILKLPSIDIYITLPLLLAIIITLNFISLPIWHPIVPFHILNPWFFNALIRRKSGKIGYKVGIWLLDTQYML